MLEVHRSCLIRLDGLKAIYYKEHWAYNDELLLQTIRYMARWLDNSMKIDDNICLKNMVQPRAMS